MGIFCERVLTSDFFKLVWENFEKTVCHDLLLTKSPDRDEREGIYAQYRGAQEFVNYLTQFAINGRKLQEHEAPEDFSEPDDEDMD